MYSEPTFPIPSRRDKYPKKVSLHSSGLQETTVSLLSGSTILAHRTHASPWKTPRSLDIHSVIVTSYFLVLSIRFLSISFLYDAYIIALQPDRTLTGGSQNVKHDVLTRKLPSGHLAKCHVIF